MGVSIVWGIPQEWMVYDGKILWKWMGSPKWCVYFMDNPSINGWKRVYCRKHPYGWKFHGDVLGPCGDGSDVGNSRWFTQPLVLQSMASSAKLALSLAKSEMGIPKQPSLPWRIGDTTDQIGTFTKPCFGDVPLVMTINNDPIPPFLSCCHQCNCLVGGLEHHFLFSH